MSAGSRRMAWRGELRRPSESFFAAFAQAVGEAGGPEAATCEAFDSLVPTVDWAGRLPHVPPGLPGLWAVWRLRPLLAEPSFLRLLGLQIHALAREDRASGAGLGAIGAGSGSWGNIGAAFASRKPALAWGEAQGVEVPGGADFDQALTLCAPDMASVGHKAVHAWTLGQLHLRLAPPPATARRMLGIALWLGASEPRDEFWNRRARVRLPEGLRVPEGTGAPCDEAVAMREVCDLGLVDLLDRWCARLAAGAGSGDLLSALVRAASERQLDARRDLEGKTSWNFVYLATLGRGLAPAGDPAPYAQAAALVNLFPPEEPEDRVRARVPRAASGDPSEALLEAILDGEASEAMGLAEQLEGHAGPGAVLGVLAEAASRNDPHFNQSHQILAVAAAAELESMVSGPARGAFLTALAKHLANSQGSGDLGRMADEALNGP
ncbi:MAG: hypothetical protein HY823_06190 [Acidobacteria bacterium]|nr:hypothetical protein [Acidobacteriota bacterium]